MDENWGVDGVVFYFIFWDLEFRKGGESLVSGVWFWELFIDIGMEVLYEDFFMSVLIVEGMYIEVYMGRMRYL